MLDVKIPKPTHAFASNTYLLSSNDEVAVIDPSVTFRSANVKGNVKYIFLTHAHFDHMLKLQDWVENTGAQVLVGYDDAPALSDSNLNCYRIFTGSNIGYYGKATTIKEGDSFPLGDKTISVIDCPGHTKGSVTLICDDCAFVGDTVFAGGGFGRCDLPGGDFTALRKSILKLLALPKDTLLYPGHGESVYVNEYKV